MPQLSGRELCLSFEPHLYMLHREDDPAFEPSDGELVAHGTYRQLAGENGAIVRLASLCQREGSSGPCWPLDASGWDGKPVGETNLVLNFGNPIPFLFARFPRQAYCVHTSMIGEAL
ncbi:hypothetical protein RJZ56_004236 [Blastomyces dermatitidis]